MRPSYGDGASAGGDGDAEGAVLSAAVLLAAALSAAADDDPGFAPEPANSAPSRLVTRCSSAPNSFCSMPVSAEKPRSTAPKRESTVEPMPLFASADRPSSGGADAGRPSLVDGAEGSAPA